MARFTVAYRRPTSSGGPEIEELAADYCRDVGDWIEFVRRDDLALPTVLRVIHRSSVASVMEVSKPAVVVHQLDDDMTPSQAADLVDEIVSLVDSDGIEVVDLRATGRFLSSDGGAALVARLDERVASAGTTLRTTALTTRREGVGGGWPRTYGRAVDGAVSGSPGRADP